MSGPGTRWVALLRGVNLGRVRRLPMADLRAALGELGLEDVRTYLQSGNVVLRTDLADPGAVADVVGAGVSAAAGLDDVIVLVRSPEELLAVRDSDPFGDTDPAHRHVTFLAAPPTTTDVAHPAPDGPDRFALDGDVVHVWCPDGYARTKLSNAFFERALGVPATTRTLRTVSALCTMLAEGLDPHVA